MLADWKHRPAPADLPADRVHLRPGRYGLGKDEPDGLPSAAVASGSAMTCWRRRPRRVQGASTSLAVDWTDLESFSRPPPPAPATAPTPRRPGATARTTCCAAKTSCSSATTSPRHHDARGGGPAVPELARRAALSSCRHDPVRAFAPVLTAMPATRDPARRHPRRFRLRPPRRRRLGASRSAGPGRSWSRTCTRTTAAPRAPTTARSSATATSTAPQRPAPCWNSGRSPAPPRQSRPRTTTARPPSSPATSSAASPPTTPTATTGCSAPPPWARSAARCGPRR